MSEQEPRFESPRSAGDTLAATAWRVTSFFGMTLVFYLLVPRVVEEIEFSRQRGKQRAQHEWAGKLIQQASLEGLSQSYQLVSQRVGPSVVHLTIESDADSQSAQSSFNRFKDAGGQGSGVIVDPAGYVMTNLHVIRDAKTIHASLSDGRKVSAQLVGSDEETDLAVLKIPSDRLIAAQWGDSERLEVGALVWAVGSPFGLERSVTSGILSAKHRAGAAGNAYQDFLQTDAAVNPGNSGGPLVDTRGEIVGINTAIVGDSYQGISFAVPASIAKNVYERLREQGKVARGWLGVRLEEAKPANDNAAAFVPGVFIVGTFDPRDGYVSPAEAAGLRTGDLITHWNEQAVRETAKLSSCVAATPIGSKAKVTAIREGKKLSFDVVVGERPSFQ